MYGLMGVCSIPTPQHAEESSKGYAACFLGSVETFNRRSGG